MEYKFRKNQQIWAYVIFFIMLLSNPPWFFQPYTMVVYLFVLFVFLAFVKSRKILTLTILDCFVLVFTYTALFVIPSAISEARYSTCLILLTIPLTTALTDKEKIKVVALTTSFLAITVAITLPFWLIHEYLVKLPVWTTMDLSELKGVKAIMNIHGFFVTIPLDNHRFYSVFNEPGVLGTLAAFILYANDYNWKDKKNIIILIGSFFTYSLAFFVLTMVGLIIRKGKYLYKLLYFIPVIVILFLVLSQSHQFKLLIINRFENLTESVEKRNSSQGVQFYDNYIGSSAAYFGKGSAFWNDNPDIKYTTHKQFVVEYGIVGLVAIIILYVSRMKKYTVRTWGILILFFLSFMQRPDLLSVWQILLFSCICAKLERTSPNLSGTV